MKLKIGKRYFLDGQKDVSGLYAGENKNSYLFVSLHNNFWYLPLPGTNTYPLPKNAPYEKCDDLVTVINL
jgi:hypothetical protein